MWPAELVSISSLEFGAFRRRVFMRVLVTGGAGYIGSHTAKALARAGVEPVVLDNLSEGHRWAVKWGPFVNADVSDADAVRRTVLDYRIEAVVHFAASAYVGESVLNPQKYFHNNAANGLKLLDVLLEAGVQAIVFSSTCAVYGNPVRVPISEDFATKPVNPYGESKLFFERVLFWYGQRYGMKWLSLRYFNAAGADPDAELGEAHAPETHLIPLVIEAALAQQPHVEVFGTDYPTPDGSAIRDYVHVSDLAEAHVRGLQYLLSSGQSCVLNLGTGKGHSVRQLIHAVERVSGRTVPVREGPRRPGDPPILVADAVRASETLGWAPRYSGLDSIIQTALKWRKGGLAGIGAPGLGVP